MTPILWPDFDGPALVDALVSYAGRQRRFGQTGQQVVAGAAASAGMPAAAAPASAAPVPAPSAGDLYSGYSSAYVSSLMSRAAASAASGELRVVAAPLGVGSPSSLVAWGLRTVLGLVPLRWVQSTAAFSSAVRGSVVSACASGRPARRIRAKQHRSHACNDSRLFSCSARLVVGVAAAVFIMLLLLLLGHQQWLFRVREEIASSLMMPHPPPLHCERSDDCGAASFNDAVSRTDPVASAADVIPHAPSASREPQGSERCVPPTIAAAEVDGDEEPPAALPARLWCVTTPEELSALGQAAAGWAHSAGSTCAATPQPAAAGAGGAHSPVVTPFMSSTASQSRTPLARHASVSEQAAAQRLDLVEDEAGAPDPALFAPGKGGIPARGWDSADATLLS